MGRKIEQNFERRFADRIDVVFKTRSLEGQERKSYNTRMNEAFKALMTAVLGREPTPAELLGIVPVVLPKRKGGL